MGKVDIDALRWGQLSRFGVEDFHAGRRFADELARFATGFDARDLLYARWSRGIPDAFWAGLFDRMLERAKRKPSPLRRFWESARADG